MTIDILIIIAGFVLLIAGANWLVSGASFIAKRYGISDLAIGLTIVAFGTSAPELVVNAISSYDGFSDLVYGNVIGSNAFNLFMILGVVGLIMPITVASSTVWKEIPMSFAAALAVLLLSNNLANLDGSGLSRLDGGLLLLGFAGFMYYVYKNMASEAAETALDDPIIATSSSLKMVGLILVGLAALIMGGKLVVDSAVNIAELFGISRKIIGLTIVAAGTSLPELVTSVVAATKGKSDIAIGNVVGSNIFNLLLVLPVSAMIHPIEYNTSFNTDLYILLGGTVFLFAAMFLSGKKKLDRWEAAVLLLVFIGYIYWQIGQTM